MVISAYRVSIRFQWLGVGPDNDNEVRVTPRVIEAMQISRHGFKSFFRLYSNHPPWPGMGASALAKLAAGHFETTARAVVQPIISISLPSTLVLPSVTLQPGVRMVREAKS